MNSFKKVSLFFLGLSFVSINAIEIDMSKSYKVATLVGSSVQSNYNTRYHYKRHYTSKRKHHVVRKKYIRPALHSDNYRYRPQVATDEKWMQISLSALGFYGGRIDGNLNSFETRTAIKKMNSAYGFGGDIYLAPKRRDALIYLGKLFDFDKTLISNRGSRSSRNRKIQTSLKINGFYFGAIDGSKGSMTRRAIYDYKSSVGLARNYYLNYEDEYNLISEAKVKNSRNIEDTLALLKSRN